MGIVSVRSRDRRLRKRRKASGDDYSTQSAMKMLVSCSTVPLRFEAQTRRLPSEENIGKASKPG